ncbi:DUF1287 domain-containing protein [Aureibacter tunicatorum]|uniref:DUF1287 domain-containing protein n=1 Tax=Aureibacter tunicatorum TaxID=866807 RepID=A0AAE3XPL0_9BACT|nr:DUF1287 domain-containing protein [Aureibacter tunicatorum]MDR6240305.1 hypothetical protein [Aureibacter tunicatorum]BDD05814.1 DUF1287 domain-containing protein [Aureibacter tunicatorum]
MKRAFNIIFILFVFCNYGFSQSEGRQAKLASIAMGLVDPNIIYDPTYFALDYPNGDVPADRGVCTDVVIRAYRKLGIDLQKEVHEDMKDNFGLYPNNWGLKRPDKNIDHRRVPNLMTFFSRRNAAMKISNNSADYQPGDIVCWDLGGGVLHIGIIVDQKSSDGQRHMIVHNIGNGQVVEDFLFQYQIIGHYRFV